MTSGNAAESISEYLESLPQTVLTRLYEKQATCLAIFRLLPPLARQYVMMLLFDNEPMSKDDFNQWTKVEGNTKQQVALQKLAYLHILKEEKGKMGLNSTFRKQTRHVLLGGGDEQSFGVPCYTEDKHKVDIKFLDGYATMQWEIMLHYMVGTADIGRKPSRGVMMLLERSGLMSGHSGRLQITNKGFHFLLQDVGTQIWQFLLQYLNMAEDRQMDLVEVLNFLFMLGSLELGMDYSTEKLTETQKVLLDDLRDYGIVYQRKSSSRRFYPTRLATTLTSDAAAFEAAVMVSTSKVHKSGSQSGSERGFIILETNYKLYAYTDSPLQIAVLNLFVHLKSRFANMVTGIITRESVRSALMNGITAEQIITYLASHAHPQMHRNSPLLPLTVVDQIRLWEMERNRMTNAQGYLYKEFRSLQDYEMVLSYGKSIGTVLWADQSKRMFFVTTEGHTALAEFIRRRLSRDK